MNEVLPFLVFAVFATLIWLQRRGRGPAAPIERSPGGPLRRIVLGDPPVSGPADAFARFGLFAAWLLGAVAIVSGSHALIWLIAPAGVLIVAVGVIVTRDAQGVRARLAERARRGFGARATGNVELSMRLMGPALLFIGLAWLTMGVLEIAS